MSERLTLELFEACIDQAFVVQVSEGVSVPMTLVEVKSLGERPLRTDGTERRESFSLVFSGP